METQLNNDTSEKTGYGSPFSFCLRGFDDLHLLSLSTRLLRSDFSLLGWQSGLRLRLSCVASCFTGTHSGTWPVAAQ